MHCSSLLSEVAEAQGTRKELYDQVLSKTSAGYKTAGKGGSTVAAETQIHT